jgi:CRISPR-associated endonuclease Csn1
MILGLDIGTRSCGIAVTRGERVELLGVRLFEGAEDSYTGFAKNVLRRILRGQRVRLKRQGQRRRHLRLLLRDAGVLATSEADPARLKALADPYKLRSEGLDLLLRDDEFAAALLHVAKRRGYVPGSETEPGNDTPVTAMGPLTSQAIRNEMRSEAYRTAGEMFFKDPFFADAKRNRAGDYKAALPRRVLKKEVAILFAAQRQFGNTVADETLERQFSEIAFEQLSVVQQAGAIGSCAYLPSKQRGARHAPTMERYRFLCALTKLTVIDQGLYRRLSPAEIALASARFGRSAKITRLDVRRWIALSPSICRYKSRRQRCCLRTWGSIWHRHPAWCFGQGGVE